MILKALCHSFESIKNIILSPMNGFDKDVGDCMSKYHMRIGEGS